MEKVNNRLDEMSAEDLRELLARRASEVQPDGRYEFLARITALPVEEQDLDEQTEEELLGEIAAFAKRVADGDYCEGWGWDAEIGEERDWGDESWAEDGAEVVRSPEEALAAANASHVAVIGGAEIYALFLPLADRIEWTEVHASPDGDTMFPAFDRGAWHEAAREHHGAEGRAPGFDFVTLLRKPSA